MLNDLQLMLLVKERERALASEGRQRVLLHEAKQAKRAAHISQNRRLLQSTILRALTIAMLIVLLALSLSSMARA